MEEGYDYLCKLSFVGDPGVGKSSLILRYVDDFVPNRYISTIGVDYRTRTINLAGIKVKLQLWDISGQDYHIAEFREYKQMDGIILVYDCTDARTYSNIPAWFAESKKFTRNAKMILIGNKCDLSGKIEVSTAREQ